MATLNLGSGMSYVAGATNVDAFAASADVVHDLNVMPYPFGDSVFDEILCLNILEHLDDVVAVMAELHRIGRPGAAVHIRVPHFRSASTYEDVTHRRGFAWRSLDMFCGEETVYGEYTAQLFVMRSRHYTPFKLPALFRMLSRMPQVTDHLLSKFVPMASIMFELEVLKWDIASPPKTAGAATDADGTIPR